MDEGIIALAVVLGVGLLLVLLLWAGGRDRPPDPRDPFGSNDDRDE